MTSNISKCLGAPKKSTDLPENTPPNVHFTLSRRAFLGTAGVGLGTLAWPNNAPGQNTTRHAPNIILIMTDDQGYGDLSCLGSPHIETPHLDALHAASTRLTNFHVSPTCAPTRAALLTGRYNNRVGVWHTIMGRSLLRRGESTLADYLGNAGYKTGIFGKWHLGDHYPYRPQDRGFQECLVHGGGGVGQTPDYWGNDYFDDTYFHNGAPTPCKGYCTDVWFNTATQFIEANHEAPFFCYIPTNAPHAPYRVPPEYSQPFKAKGLTDAQANFHGMLKNIDENVGRMLARLDELKLADDTIVIFMTDNGTAEGNPAGMRGKKGSEYEGGHRVPCFIKWPGGKLSAGSDLPLLAAHFDLLPTLLDLCGVPAKSDAAFDGMSLRPWLEDPALPESDRAIIVDSQRIEDPEKWRACAVLEKDWRLVNGKELYDLQSDPEQRIDRAADFPDRVVKLRGDYETWWDDVSQTFNQYCPIVIGAPGQNTTVLNSHDWHGEKPAWNQTHILKGEPGNGFWAIEVAEAGEYHFDLRRWPVEASTPIRGALEGGAALAINEAKLSIGDQTLSAPVGETEHAVRFTLMLEKGKIKLKTEFLCDDGKARGAYYVVVARARD